MAKTKQVKTEEQEEPEEDKPDRPQQAVRRRKPQEVSVDNKALRDMLTRLASLSLNDLLQLTDLPLKLINAIPK